MFLLIPVGIEGNEVRVPAVCIGIVALCALAFAASWVVPQSNDAGDRVALREALEEWESRPYLELPPAFDQHEQIGQVRAQRLQTHTAPAGEELRLEQQAFTQKLQKILSGSDRSLLRRLSLVPERGYFQLGLLSHMFIHFGWLHLIGNLLFFYMCGPLLEDTWGRLRFGAFYLLGGLLAATAHFLIDRHSGISMGGASGAIAACMGAFAVRFPTRKVAMGYLGWVGFRVFRGIWHWPAWLCGVLWFGSEALTALLTGGKASGVAVMAHVGGFAFGAAVALGMKATGIEKQFIPLGEQDVGPLTISVLKEVEEARALVQGGDRPAARARYEAGLKRSPDDVDASVGLVLLDFEEGQRPPALARLERLLGKLLRGKEEAQAIGALLTVWSALEPDELKPPLAFALARASEEAGEAGQGLSQALFLRGAQATGVLGAKALLRAAELQLKSGAVPEAAASLDRLLGRTDAGPQLLEQARALRKQVPDRGLPLELEAAPASPARPAPRLVACALIAVTEQGLTLRSPGGEENQVPFSQVLGVAAGLIPVAVGGAAPRGLLLVDLILGWGDTATPAVSLRLDSDTTLMSRLFSGSSAPEVYGRFLSHLLEASGATPLPDAASLKGGKFPRYPSAEARDAAIFPTG